MFQGPARSTLFPYTTLFRSSPSSALKSKSPPGPISTSLPSSSATFHGRKRRRRRRQARADRRSEEHTSELQSLAYLVCRLLLVNKSLELLRLGQRFSVYFAI